MSPYFAGINIAGKEPTTTVPNADQVIWLVNAAIREPNTALNATWVECSDKRALT